MICLGVESTAHTFGASMVDDDDRVITNVNSTYRPPAGVGIHPRKASEHHAAVSDSIIGKAIRSSEGGQFDPDAIAYSAGPGLGPCLRIGATVSRARASCLGKPLVPVHPGGRHPAIDNVLSNARGPPTILI